MRQRFWRIAFDVTDLLPKNWQRDVLTVAASADGAVRYLEPRYETDRVI